MTAQCPPETAAVLPNELWIRSFSYLDRRDLSALGGVCRNFLLSSSADSLWEVACRRRWRGKQNASRFAAGNGRTTVGAGSLGEEEEENDRRRRVGCFSTSVDGRIVLDDARVSTAPVIVDGRVMRDPRSWKESYALAEIDSRRRYMSVEELVNFRWQLIYDGSPSRMGLRKFNEDGTYWSPYMGLCTWMLDGERLAFAGMSLLVERNASNWGWVIGRGQRTEYHSVEGAG